MSNVNTVSVVETAAVEGTLIVKDDVTIDSLADNFTAGLEKSTRGILEAGRAAFLAKKKKKTEWNEFCRKVTYGNKPSTMNKFIAIGRNYDLYLPYVDKLPSSWTNLYLLTSLSDKTFKELAEAGNITPDLKGFEINRLLGKAPESNKSTKETKNLTTADSEISVTIKVFSLNKTGGLSSIVDLAKTIGFEVIFSEEYTKYLEAQNLALPEAA